MFLRPLPRASRVLNFSPTCLSSGYATFPRAPSITLAHLTSVTPSDETIKEARVWLDQFKLQVKNIPPQYFEVSYARSSGPGGQNVNKTSSKVLLRCGVNHDWIPAWAQSVLRKSPHYVQSTDSILIKCDVHRSQAQNLSEAQTRLYTLILEACASPIPSPTSEATKARIKEHEKKAAAARKVEKMKRSRVKEGRKGKGGGADW
ncbi:RF-1 domain-containing protein [Flagelloscypha sp. PMI_526]|nr:RF-1 domain-containing protein [Flagelloscypha sp. PMI_526]